MTVPAVLPTGATRPSLESERLIQTEKPDLRLSVGPAPGLIRIRGARQHNLKNLDLDIHTGEMTVVTGPSLGQVQPGVRYAVCRGPAALR